MSTFNKKISSLLVTAAILFCGLDTAAQNLNTPNKTGPMGTEVNTFTGNLFMPREDMYVISRGLSINMTFYYNSFFFEHKFGFGKGWSNSYNIFYKNDTLNGKTIFWGDGREDAYKLSGSSYTAPKGIFNVLTQYQPNKFMVKTLQGLKYYFDNNTVKKITKLEDPNGNSLTFTYTDTLLTGIATSAGQSISLFYTAGNLTSITDALSSPSRTYSYQYDAAGNLTQVTDPSGGKMKYNYLVNGPLKSVADKNNNVIDLIYYPDFTISEIIGCNKRQSFSYDTTINETTVTDYVPGGQNQVTKYGYRQEGDFAWLTSLKGNCCGYNMNFEFDADGNKIRETDANGNVTAFTYDARGNVLTIKDALNQTQSYTWSSDYNKVLTYTDAKGFTTTLTYNASGNLTRIREANNAEYNATYAANGDVLTSTDPKGNTYTYTYDAAGNPATVTGPNGYHAAMSFDAHGNILSYTDAAGNSTAGEYDILNRLKKITDPALNNVQFGYDAAGNIVSVKDESGATAQIKYDASNRPVEFSDVTGKKTTAAYDGMDNMIQWKDAAGHAAAYTYDARNRMNRAANAIGDATDISYDSKGNVTGINMANGERLTVSYDALDRIVAVSDLSGNASAFTYDKNNNIASFVNGTGAITTAEYDSVNRVKKIVDPLGNFYQLSYDQNGNMTSLTDRTGATETLTYDGHNRLKTHTDENGAVVTFSYDADGNPVSLTDENNHVTNYTYDNLNRTKRVIFPDGKFKEFSYDSKGNIVLQKMPDGTNIVYAYDSLNRIKTKTLPDGQIYSYTYDPVGRVLTAANSTGTVALTYDGLSRIASESFDGRTTRYNYNTAGRTMTTVYPDSTVITRTFDTRNRLISVAKNSNIIVSYQYNNAGQVISKTFGNGVVTNLQYDLGNRLSTYVTGSFQNSVLSYDNEGRISSINRQNDPASSETFGYDAAHRLTSYKRGIIGGSPVLQNTYSYDALGNRTAAVLNGASVTYSNNNLNQLTGTSGGQNVAYAYDNNGNLTYDGIFYKKYDAEGRLQKDSAGTANVISYQYDAFGRRVIKSYNGAPLKYTYAGLSQIEERDGITNALKNRTVFSNFLTPVLNEKGNSAFYYHQNDLNSVEAITGSTGSLAERYQYDVYGRPAVFDGSNNSIAGSATGNRFGFTGQEYDSATGSYRFMVRNYSPQTGRFNQRDGIGYGDGTGMYQYVHNDPSNGVDILGFDDCGGYNTTEWLTVSNVENVDNFLGNLVNVESWTQQWKVENIWKRIGNLQKTIEGIENNADLLQDLNRIKEGAVEMEQLSNKYREGLGKAGKGLGLLDNVIKFGKVLDAVNDPHATANDTRKAGANFLLSLLGHSGVGGVYQLLDFAIEKTTGKNLVDQADYAGSFYGNLYSHWVYGVPMDYSDPNEKKVPVSHWKPRIIDCPQNGKPGGPRIRKHWYYLPNGDSTEIIQALDPNEIIGPDGEPSKHWVSVKDRLPYTILYENSKAASAPAKYVKVTYAIDPKQDPATFQLGTFGFNNQTFAMPPSLASYSQRLDCRDSLGLFVDITAGYDQLTNTAFWELQSIDPVTLIPPTDPLKGLLLLQDSTKPTQGHGFVNFSIKPRATDITLDTIHATANIIFDANPVISTNYVKNTVDAFAPTSHMVGLPATSSNPVHLAWTGADDVNGCGIRFYTLYVSTDGVNFNIVRSGIARTDTTFTGAAGTTYSFFVLATDTVGNTELLGPGAIVSTFIGAAVPVTWLSFTGKTINKDNVLDWSTASEQNSRNFNVERSLNGTQFTSIGTVSAAGNSNTVRNYQFVDKNIDLLNAPVMYYRIRQNDLDGSFRNSNVVRLTYNQKGTVNSIVYPNPTQGMITITVGDPALIGTQATIYDTNGKLLDRIKITANSQVINMSKYVNGTYIIKLSNNESLKVIKM